MYIMLSLLLSVMQLPDGNEIQVGVDRFKVPELLFQPVSVLLAFSSGCLHVSAVPYKGNSSSSWSANY